jgi:hypothetical protein
MKSHLYLTVMTDYISKPILIGFSFQFRRYSIKPQGTDLPANLHFSPI